MARDPFTKKKLTHQQFRPVRAKSGHWAYTRSGLSFNRELARAHEPSLSLRPCGQTFSSTGRL